MLGGTPVSPQNYNFSSVPKDAAGIVMFFQGVEAVGASAYLGAAGSIKNFDVLEAALSIHAVEAEHAAALADLVSPGSDLFAPEAFATPRTPDQVMAIVAPFFMAMAAAPAAPAATTAPAATARPAAPAATTAPRTARPHPGSNGSHARRVAPHRWRFRIRLWHRWPAQPRRGEHESQRRSVNLSALHSITQRAVRIVQPVAVSIFARFSADHNVVYSHWGICVLYTYMPHMTGTHGKTSRGA